MATGREKNYRSFFLKCQQTVARFGGQHVSTTPRLGDARHCAVTTLSLMPGSVGVVLISSTVRGRSVEQFWFHALVFLDFFTRI